ncbi:MAG: hypothetical protein JXK05_11880 [Campylobacterales bacterium]|nr:hypothetical protein [Campylobacterales bacterium]
MSYRTKARLIENIDEIAQYRRILDNDRFDEEEPHWNRIGKNAITLFGVLMDQDLRHLVLVLRAYPRYIPIVCEHFRYSYSYSEKSGDIEAVSELLWMGEPYFTKQFVRNVMRKLPKLEGMSLEALLEFSKTLAARSQSHHPIVTKHYTAAIKQTLAQRSLHPLQRLMIEREAAQIALVETFDYEAEDRDAALDIPYMT